MSANSPESPASLGCIADRYELREPLGRGGMATVHRATDRTTGADVAIKQLRATSTQNAGLVALFEREFHTLAQLRHPSVISVYEYGLHGDGPYYTMELLDGGDLRDRTPLPWRQACAFAFDVCSSLALLHSRRLLHRDISPRNVRCTRDGRAKLIDFGAMGPMLPGGGQIVGTPAFIPPETVHRSAIDGRSDLFSLGATLYYALTGHSPYPARSFADVIGAWRVTPAPPSMRAPDVPRALDDLVLSLLSIEPATRPRSAYEVMQRLAALAGLEGRETAAVSAAYLTAPTLVGRDELLGALREGVMRAVRGSGGALLIRGEPGLGRSRALDACALEAKTLGATVLRAGAGSQPGDFALATSLAQHLLDALPDRALCERFPELFALRPDASAAAQAQAVLRSAAELKSDAAGLVQAISRCLLEVSRQHPLVIAVDDVQRIDAPSAAVLAEIADRARRNRLFLALTSDSASDAALTLEVLERRCESLSLQPLSAEQTRTLLESLFGDVDHVATLAAAIYEIARGNPRRCMELAQHLVDRGLIRYADGTWTLPSTLAAADLPRSAEDALAVKLELLDPHARWLAEAQALAFFQETMSDEDYRRLRPDVDTRTTARAVAQLLEQQVLVGDGGAYSFANRVWPAVLKARIAPERARDCHAALAELYAGSGIVRIPHLFEAGLDERALDALLEALAAMADQADLRNMFELRAERFAASFDRAIALAARLGRPRRQQQDLLRWSTGLSVASGDVAAYWRVAPAWFEQLKQDSGLALWEADPDTADAGARLMRALQGAVERFGQTPEAERVYPVDQAIKLLAEYVAFSIATGARSYDNRLLGSLPPLLEPFISLSPLLHALWQNTIGTLESSRDCQHERARERWIEVHRKLGEHDPKQVQHLDMIRNAIAAGIGMLEATFGLQSAADWAALLDADPAQRLSGLYLRQVVRLEQGDWSGADKLRREAEVLALQQRVPSMFTQQLAVELTAHANACDLAGVKRVIERQALHAQRMPNWTPYAIEGRARFDLLRGDVHAAKTGFERCQELTALDAQRRSPALVVWVLSQTGLAQCHRALGQNAEARRVAQAALAICEELGIGPHSYELVRTLALAEASDGEFAGAAERIDRIIAQQTAIGATGLRLGMSYEARALVAIWSGDVAAYEHYARLTAHEYRYGARSPLSARYERLKLEASRRGLPRAAELSEFESEGGSSGALDVDSMVALAMTGTDRLEERAQRAVKLICDARAASAAHLYLVRKDGSPWRAASFGAARAGHELLRQVRDYIEIEQEERQAGTVVVSGTQVHDGPAAHTTASASVGGVDYELHLLTCVVDGEGRIAGAIALAPGEHSVFNPVQGQLLSALAAHLLEIGEVTVSAPTLIERGARARRRD
jgi:hypothetical protein